MANYESEIQSTLQNTPYPFIHPCSLPTQFIIGLQIITTERVYLYSATPYELLFKNLAGTVTGICTYNNVMGVHQVTGSIYGYVELLYPITQNYTFANTESEIGYGINYFNTPSKINGYTWVKDGNNTEYYIKDNHVQCICNLGAGLGEFCGTPIDKNAIYSINGYYPDEDGKITLTEFGFIRIRSEDHTITLDTVIPDVICERDGYPGQKGPTGLGGNPGVNGADAIEPQIIYDPECR